MFDLDQLTADCRAALAADRPSREVREIVARAVSDPAGVVRALGEPKKGGVQALYRAPDLTILNVLWGPKFVLLPHDHAMWAVIGVYGGREDNILWRRLPDDAEGQVEAAGAKSLAAGDTIAFGADVIHSVINPLSQVTGALHIYGGDFFDTPRSEWDPATLHERPYDIDRAMRAFAGS